MSDPLAVFSTRQTPQSEPIVGSSQVANSAGGYSFAVDDWMRLRRFLILGTAGGTYYISEGDLTKENATLLFKLLEIDGPRVVSEIVSISVEGRAAKQNPCLFALAAAASHGTATSHALTALPQVARTGTHLFIFARYVEQFRGWGRGLKRAVADWYLTPDVDRVAYQAVKYRSRERWSHRDLLRLAHPKTNEVARKALFDWICRSDTNLRSDLPAIVEGYLQANSANLDQVASLVTQFDLPWEALPTEALNRRDVWEALLPHMGLTALLRNLPKLTNLEIIAPMSTSTGEICARLTDPAALQKARVHPMAILNALLTYKAGRGFRGSSTWIPVGTVVDALDAAFYAAFGNVTPANKRTMLALDVSGSMGMYHVAGSQVLNCREASAAMALVTANTEPNWMTFAFTAGRQSFGSTAITPLSISPRQRLDDVIKAISGLPFGGTDCALPMLHALDQKLEIDTFCVYTDSETWAGNIHPTQALEQYRQRTGIPARLVVVGMASNGFTIADPNDAGMMDVVGFDSAAPELISSFSRGEI